MKVALGTHEVTDEERKAIKKALGFRGGKASREEARDFLLASVNKSLADAVRPHPEEEVSDE